MFYNTISNLDFDKIERGIRKEKTLDSSKSKKLDSKKSIYSELMNTIDQVVILKEQEIQKKTAQKSMSSVSKGYTSLGRNQSTEGGKQKKKFIRVNGSLEEQGCIEIVNMKRVPKESPKVNL